MDKIKSFPNLQLKYCEFKPIAESNSILLAVAIFMSKDEKTGHFETVEAEAYITIDSNVALLNSVMQGLIKIENLDHLNRMEIEQQIEKNFRSLPIHDEAKEEAIRAFLGY